MIESDCLVWEIVLTCVHDRQYSLCYSLYSSTFREVLSPKLTYENTYKRKFVSTNSPLWYVRSRWR